MTQTSTNEKTESLQPTEGAEMLERFWSEIRAEVDSINIVCLEIYKKTNIFLFFFVSSLRWIFVQVNYH
jgi:hypothetical protein